MLESLSMGGYLFQKNIRKLNLIILLSSVLLLAIIIISYINFTDHALHEHLETNVSPLTNLQALQILNEGHRQLALILLFSIIVLMALTGVALYWSTQLMSRKKLYEALRTLHSLEQGNLSVRIADYDAHNTLGKLALSINTVAESRESAEKRILNLNNELRALNQSLEERVRARVRDLETAADVSKQLTQVLNLDLLMQQIVRLINTKFGLYYSTIFLLDDQQKTLIRKANADNTGEPLQAINQTFSIEARPSLVAQAARTRQIVIVNDVRHSPDHYVQRALPETRSEIAIPMLIGSELIGVLDLQANQVDFFHEDEVRVLSTLADGLAVATRNAQLFEEAHAAHRIAERANLAKSQFLASVSHELRTPLNGIMNFTRFVMDGVVGPVNEKQSDLLKKVLLNSNHLLSLINDVLDISRIESGSLKLLVEPNVNIREELEYALDNVQTTIGNKPVQIIYDREPKLPLIAVDRRRLRQIFFNVLSNACKFTTNGFVKISALAEADALVVSVQDTGPGIAPEEYENVFEAFRQTSSGIRTGGGTGLGMAISRRLARAHSGELWFDSVLGEGTTFYLKLPLQPTPNDAVTVAPAPETKVLA